MKWLRNMLVALCATLVTAGALTSAEAKRVRIPVGVPGTGSSETLVKVMDLPRRPELV